MEETIRRFEEAVRHRPAGGPAPAAVPYVSPSRVEEPGHLARLHDAALFLRAFPRCAEDVGTSDRILREIPARMAELSRQGTDLSGLDDFECVGIGGTSLTMDFSWGMARWLARRHGLAASIAWDQTEPERLGPALSRHLPFLSERSLADAGVDYRGWLGAALGAGERDGGLRFLVDRFERTLGEDDRSVTWDLLGLTIRWRLGTSRASRTLARLPHGRLFIDPSPLLARRDVSMAREGAAPLSRLLRLDPAEGARFLDAARSAVGVRYRELHAFTWGNRGDVVRGDGGRGLSIWCCGLHPEHRLPLRAGYGFLLVRNGVPIGYGDAYVLGDRLDLSFNVFYAFRDGESAFAYARTVAFFRSWLPVRSVSVEPYQIGQENEEAIRSGAFWFYRKLGFRSADPALEDLIRGEESRLARRPGTRTTLSRLRRIAGAPIVLDLPGRPPGAWSEVSLDALGLSIQRQMAASGLSPETFRRAVRMRVARALGLTAAARSPGVARALGGLAPVLDLLPGLARLSVRDRNALRALIVRKGGRSEAGFARALARARFLPAAIRNAVRRARAPR